MQLPLKGGLSTHRDLATKSSQGCGAQTTRELVKKPSVPKRSGSRPKCGVYCAQAYKLQKQFR